MDDRLSAIPWHTPALWREANASLDRSLRGHRHRLNDALHLAEKLHRQLISIFPCMDTLCRLTCFACEDSCCRRAWVWTDFRDLLFLHLASVAPPDRQLLGQRGEHCRYSCPDGCRLDRIQRPFICTWYLCPAQIRALNRWPAKRKRLRQRLQQIKRDRREMEDRFVEAICQSHSLEVCNGCGPQREISSLSMQQAIR